MRRGCLLLLLSLAFVPMLLGGAKQFTNVYCPKQIEEFGGEYVHQGVLECRNPANEGRSPGRCFPAGHASGGFALMMLFFCFRSRRDRWAGLGAGLIAGWGMGFYQRHQHEEQCPNGKLGGDHAFRHVPKTSPDMRYAGYTTGV